jgi:bacterioferritin-associated ferredoxin
MAIEAGMADKREALACYCMNVSPGDLRQLVLKSSAKDFPSFCEDTGVGMRCTSCLLQVEPAFLEHLAERMKTNGTADAAGRHGKTAGNIPLKIRIAEFIGNLGPVIPSPRFTNVPILRRDGVSTILCMANGNIRASKARAAGYAGKVTVFRQDGTVVAVKSIKLESGGYFELDVSQFLPAPAGDGYVVGSARVDFRPTSNDPMGIIRPHFRLLTPKSANAVHCLPTSRESAFHTFLPEPAGITTMFHLQNGQDVEDTATIKVVDDETGDEVLAREQALPPRGSSLMIFTSNQVPERMRGRLLRFECRVRGWVRGFIIVEDALGRLTADHI